MRSRQTASARRIAPQPVPPPSGIEGLIDELRATVLALLASLQDKERELCGRADSDPSPGVARGLADIYVLRRWADRTLKTIDDVEGNRGDGLGSLLGELSEFAEILRVKQPAVPPDPPLTAVGS